MSYTQSWDSTGKSDLQDLFSKVLLESSQPYSDLSDLLFLRVWGSTFSHEYQIPMEADTSDTSKTLGL